MAQFLCVGGFFDGEWHEAPADGRPWLKLAEPQKFVTGDFSKPHEVITIPASNVHTYKLQEWCAEGERRAIWVPEDQNSTIKSFDLLVENYHPRKPVRVK